MVKFPRIFARIKGQFFASNTAFGGRLSLKIIPKPFQTVYVITPVIGALAFAVFYCAMDVTPVSDPGIRLPSVGTNSRTFFDLPSR